MSNALSPRSLTVTGVSRAFAGVQALTNVDLEIVPGQVLGLIGPNGAGKSTLVNIISGYDFPDSGQIVLNSNDITTMRAHKRARNGLARTFQQGHLFSGLTVRDNLEVTALGAGASAQQARDRAESLLAEFHIHEIADHAAHSLPHGLERLVGVARALALEPDFVLLDEPAAGLNEGEIGDFADNIRHLRDRGLGILLIDHNVKLILSIRDRIHVLVEGKTLLEGTPEEVRASDELAEAYLGRSGSAHS